MISPDCFSANFTEYICTSKSVRCRLCLQKSESDELENIFSSFENSTIAQYVAEFANISISKNDCFSKVVCKLCLKQLGDIESLRRRINACNEYLNQLFRLYKSSTREFSHNIALKPLQKEKVDEIDSKSAIEPLEIREQTENIIQSVKDEETTIKQEHFDEDNKIDIVENKLSEDFPKIEPQSENSVLIKKSGVLKQIKKRLRRRNPNVKYPCNGCDKIFETKCGRDKHLAKHTGEQYKCEICLQEFMTRYALCAHKEQQHSVDKALECKECDKQFSTLRLLNNHLESHLGNPKYQCDACGKRFTHPGSFRNHKRYHRTITELKCQVCNRIIRSHDYDAMKKHMETHQENRGKPCPKCEKTFKSKRGLTAHLNNHNGALEFECELCPKKYSTKNSLKNHIASAHSTVKPYSCEICFKTFSLKNSWYIHGAVHAKENPFPCTVCDKIFGYPSHLKGHMKAVHGIIEEHNNLE